MTFDCGKSRDLLKSTFFLLLRAIVQTSLFTLFKLVLSGEVTNVDVSRVHPNSLLFAQFLRFSFKEILYKFLCIHIYLYLHARSLTYE